MIELWNGRHACLLQSALRLTKVNGAQQVRKPCASRSPWSYVTARCCWSADETMTQRASAGSSRQA
ncbi:hypothetical protein JCM4914_49070 [Streptomyces platensis subsp. malvinus]